jgi:hypothetical protein
LVLGTNCISSSYHTILKIRWVLLDKRDPEQGLFCCVSRMRRTRNDPLLLLYYIRAFFNLPPPTTTPFFCVVVNVTYCKCDKGDTVDRHDNDGTRQSVILRVLALPRARCAFSREKCKYSCRYMSLCANFTGLESVAFHPSIHSFHNLVHIVFIFLPYNSEETAFKMF